MPQRKTCIIICCLAFSFFFRAQTDTLHPETYRNRRIALISTTSALTVGSLVYLNYAWYSQYNTGKFHFFNDNAEWLQMDKVGHFYTNYQIARLMMNAFENAGYNRKQKLFIGGSIGLGYMTAIEILDGFSRGWGFSWGDEVANSLGTSLAVCQEAFWNEQRIQVKFSYANSGLAKYNPDLLGDTPYTRILKDYNGQTLWLSVNPYAFMKRDTKFPKWLNVTLGYSAYGMLGGFENNFVVQDANGNVLKFERARRYYLSLDIDLTRIKTKSTFLKTLFSVVNVLKFPAPAIQFSQGKFRGYYLYY